MLKESCKVSFKYLVEICKYTIYQKLIYRNTVLIMGLLNSVVKRSILVMIMWLILGTVSAPAFFRIGEVTEYRAERLLPSGAESVRAADFVRKISGRAAITDYHIILVKGVNASDPRLVDIDESIYEYASSYTREYDSPYAMVRRLYKELDPKLYESSLSAYSSLENAYLVLKTLSENRWSILQQIIALFNYTQVLKQYYEYAWVNRGVYRDAAAQLYSNLSQLPGVLVNISSLYNSTVEQIRGLNTTVLLVENMIVISDSFYSFLLGNMDSIYSSMRNLNLTLIAVNTVYYIVSQLYTATLFDVLRVHYYLLYNTTAYETGLTEQEIRSVIAYTNVSGYPVSPELVVAVYSYVLGTYGTGYVNETALYTVASRLCEDMLVRSGTPPDVLRLNSLFLSVYNVTLLSTSLQILSAVNTSYYRILLSHPIEGQLNLLRHLYHARSSSLPAAVELFADSAALMLAEAMGLPVPERVSPALKSVLVEVYHVGYPPYPEELRVLVINTTYTMLTSLGYQLPPRTALAALNRIYYEGSSKEIAVDSLNLFCEEVFTDTPSELRGLIAKTVLDFDPEGLNLMAYNRTLALTTASTIVAGLAGIPSGIIYSVAAGVLDEYSATYEVLRYKFESLGYTAYLPVLSVLHANRGIVSYEVFREVLLQALTPILLGLPYIGEFEVPLQVNVDNYTINILVECLAKVAWSGNLTLDYAFRVLVGAPLVMIVAAMIPRALSVDVVDQVLLGAPIVNVLVFGEQLDVEEVVAKTVDYTIALTGAVDVEQLLGAPIRTLAKNFAELPFNATQSDIVKALAQVVRGRFTEAGLNVTVDDVYWMFSSVLITDRDLLDVITELASRYAPPLADPVTFSQYLRAALEVKDPAVLYNGLRLSVQQKVFNETVNALKGLMVSKDLAAFLVVMIPVGVNESERAGNVQKVIDYTRRILAEKGYGSAEVFTISGDVLELEVKEYISRDIERVNRISMIVTVLIALLIVGGLVATALPFAGVATSLLVSHGILYLLAKSGVIGITSWSRMLAVTTALGLGMNYSSYIVIRFREIYPGLRDPRKAALEAVKYALPAIMASSSTDIVGFAVMKLAWEFPLIASIGEAVPIAIAVVLAVSLTLTPALLSLFGDKEWFWWPRKPGTRLGEVAKFKLTITRALILVAVSLIMLSLGVLGFASFRGSHEYQVFIPEDSSSYRAYSEFTVYFPHGRLLPIYVTCVLKDGYSAYDERVIASIEALQNDLLNIEGVAEVYSYVNPGTRPRELYVGPYNRSLYIEVVLGPSPLSREGVDLTREVRSVAKSRAADYCEEVLVGGLSASSLEIEEMLDRVFWSRVVPVALVLMVVFMSLSFQSVASGFVPMFSIIIGYLMGIASVSLIAQAFNQPMLWFLPLLTLPAVLGVGLDYNSYYMNRQRYELLSGRDSYEASSVAIRSASHVVLGLGLIVSATYASLVTGSSWGVRELGIALTTAVFTTTVLAAYVLTPSVLALLGEKAWWPGFRRWTKRG